jgi:DNA-binding MarR family transcriptional regulator
MSGDDQQGRPALPLLAEIGLSNFAPYLMNRIMGRYNASLRAEMAALGLTTPKMRALAVLSVIDGPLIRDLAVYSVVEQSTLSRALDQLDADGLVRREADPDDSRATRVFLTEAGRTAFETLWPCMAESYARMFRGISDDERRAFVGTLQKMLANIRKHEI